MNASRCRLVAWCAAGLIWWPLWMPRPACADEARAHVRAVPEARALVLAVLDTSAAAATPLRARPGPSRAGDACPASRVYWRRGGGPPPPCDSAQWVSSTATSPVLGLKCAHAAPGLAVRGFHVARRLRQWDPVGRQWAAPVAGARGALECREDAGRHGAAPGTWHAADGDAAPWSGVAAHEIAWDEDAATYTLYSSAFVARWYAVARDTTTSWVVQRSGVAALDAAATTDDEHGYAFGLLRHSWNGRGGADADADGGMVVAAAIASERLRIPDVLRGVVLGGGAPWTETLYEAARYLRAEPVDFGRDSRATPEFPLPSVRTSRSPSDATRYADHWPHACSRAHVLAFATSAPTQDASGRANALSLPGFPPAEACDGDAAAPCLPPLLRWLGDVDMSPRPGRQRARPAWLALAPDTPEPRAARTSAGADWAIGASDRADALPLLLEWLVRARLETPGATLPANPQPHVSALAAAEGVLYSASFLPGADDRWSGEVRRIVRAGADALESRESFRPAAPARRRLYTNLLAGALTAPGNALDAANAALTPALLGLAPGEHARRDRTLSWARGVDTEDVDGDGDRLEGRVELGALVGGGLATVRYATGVRVYAGTSDGMLHAFDALGIEHWAFVPRGFLAHLDELRTQRTSGTRHAGLDAELRTLIVDRTRDGIVDVVAGDRAVLLFGLRRGGRAYLAVDVSEADAPRVLWTLTPRELPALAQTWAAPVPARLTIAGARQNADRRVVLLAGGHDPAQDAPRARARDRIGAALYLVDAYSGDLLWHANGRAAAAPDLIVDELDFAIAATPRALDLDENGELDRAYVADTGGRVFRFDFRSGATRAALARASLLADVGGSGADDRRFYAEPDVALVRRTRGADYLAVTLGSGFAPDPNAADAANRLYSFRDPLLATTGRTLPLTDAELPEAATGVAPDAPGWKLALHAPGERILVPVRTIDHRAYVPAYRPPADGVAPDCTQRPGTNRILAADVRDAAQVDVRVRPPSGQDESAAASAAITGVAPAIAIVGLAPANCSADCPRDVVALLGLERLDVRWPGRIVRTGWAEREVE